MRWPIRRGSSDTAWANASERGSELSLRFIVWSIRKLGEAPTRILLVPIAVYFCLFAPTARRASRAYLERLDRFQERPPRSIGLRDFYRHVYMFAEILLDRFALWAGGKDKFTIDLHGREHMEPLVAAGRGALLIGAHLGSFDMLRLIADQAGIPVNVIMYTGNAEKVNAAFEALDPDCNLRVIDIDPTSTRAAFEIRSCAQRGEFVAILGDRPPLGGSRPRVRYADFLGRRAPFSEGPFLIAMALRLPVILTVALKTGPHRYDAYLETLATNESVPVRERGAAVQAQIERFAAALEKYCQRAPMQWFNFYDFWAGAAEAESGAKPADT